MNAIERNASVELAWVTPRFLYIAVATSGDPAPKELLMKALPASTLAADSGYASGKILEHAVEEEEGSDAEPGGQAESMMGMIQ